MKKFLAILVLSLSFVFFNQNVSHSKSCNEIAAGAKNNWARSWIRGTICNNNLTGSLKKLEMKCAKKAAKKKTDKAAKETYFKCYYN